MEKKRSVGVTLCGIYAILTGLFHILSPLMVIGCSKIGIIVMLTGIVPFGAG